MKFINLTPHTITVLIAEGDSLIVWPSGRILRAEVYQERDRTLPNGAEVVVTKRRLNAGEIPPREKETIYIVSSLVAHLLWHRQDIVAPDTGPDCVRDSKTGHILAVRRFVRYQDD